MKDIDFDELDKAVNSLMGGIKTKSDKPEPKTLTISPTLKDDEQPAYDNITQAAERIGSETIIAPAEKTEILSDITTSAPKPEPAVEKTNSPAQADASVKPSSSVVQPATPAVSRTGGRFMDVMHPSSDMKTSTTSSAPVAKVSPVAPKAPSREGVLIQPPEPPRDTPSKPQDNDTPTVIEKPQDVAAGIVIPEPAIPVEETPQQVTVPSIPEVIPPQPQNQAPLVSPFLAGAKVEKRPLGGAQAEDENVKGNEDVSSFEHQYAIDNSADTQLAPDAANTDLPAELHTDLLAIETNLAELSEDHTEQNATVQPLKPDTATSSEIERPKESVAVEQAADPADGAIYDVSAYHTPIAHPKKHTTEWLWIGVIVFIVIVCAAGAAAFYLIST